MKIAKIRYTAGMLTVLLLSSQGLCAGWSDMLNTLGGKAPGGTPASATAGSLSQAEIAAGLKEALSTGVQRAVSLLGKNGGFMDDATVKIMLPESVESVAKGLRMAGQGALVDDFVASMNRAAEKAVPATASILTETISNMSLQDAKGILSGPQDAATQYFRQHNEQQLAAAILPIVQDATAQAGVTSAYKNMTSNLGFLSQLGASQELNLDQYVTQKTLDGLFTKLAMEEKQIREDPVARSTQLLKKVFGSMQP
jgi:hypothetical protein